MNAVTYAAGTVIQEGSTTASSASEMQEILSQVSFLPPSISGVSEATDSTRMRSIIDETASIASAIESISLQDRNIPRRKLTSIR